MNVYVGTNLPLWILWSQKWQEGNEDREMGTETLYISPSQHKYIKQEITIHSGNKYFLWRLSVPGCTATWGRIQSTHFAMLRMYVFTAYGNSPVFALKFQLKLHPVHIRFTPVAHGKQQHLLTFILASVPTPTQCLIKSVMYSWSNVI